MDLHTVSLRGGRGARGGVERASGTWRKERDVPESEGRQQAEATAERPTGVGRQEASPVGQASQDERLMGEAQKGTEMCWGGAEGKRR